MILLLITGQCRDIGRFKVPTLRAVATRAPYFHNGSVATLDDVVRMYDERFGIGFTASEKSDLSPSSGPCSAPFPTSHRVARRAAARPCSCTALSPTSSPARRPTHMVAEDNPNAFSDASLR